MKNFAAGLTLLFERRVHVGDVVQIPSREIFGRVIEIGMRAVVVRNWDGAEVIVPNMDLITGAVTNWTLSDELRRIELPVGVAYGTDPERVVSLLLEVARAHEDVLERSARPRRCSRASARARSTSCCACGPIASTTARRRSAASSRSRPIAALREAGIEIPFPQRDLHVASVSPAVRAIFGAKEEE